jgi:hypothetical protein
MSDATISGNLVVNGQLVVTGQMYLPASTVTAANIVAAAGIEATKLQHQYEPLYAQSGTASAVTIPLHRVRGSTATVVAVVAGSIAAAVGDSTVTIDVRKNGTTILSGAIVLDNGNAARVGEAGTVTVTGGVAGDLYEIVVTTSIGTGTLPTGLFVQAVIREDAA